MLGVSQGKLYFIKDLTLKLNHDFSTRASSFSLLAQILNPKIHYKVCLLCFRRRFSPNY